MQKSLSYGGELIATCINFGAHTLLSRHDFDSFWRAYVHLVHILGCCVPKGTHMPIHKRISRHLKFTINTKHWLEHRWWGLDLLTEQNNMLGQHIMFTNTDMIPRPSGPDGISKRRSQKCKSWQVGTRLVPSSDDTAVSKQIYRPGKQGCVQFDEYNR